jgi:hypothetical protein
MVWEDVDQNNLTQYMDYWPAVAIVIGKRIVSCVTKNLKDSASWTYLKRCDVVFVTNFNETHKLVHKLSWEAFVLTECSEVFLRDHLCQ